MTVRDALALGSAQLTSAGVDSPALDARLLLAHACARPASWPRVHLDDVLTGDAEAAFLSLLARRVAREPLAWLLGEWEFYGRPFLVTSSVLVPRPETEILVERLLRALPDSACLVADVGTGSGAIAVTLALERPSLHLIAIDASASALAVARNNARRHGVSQRVRLLHGDLLAPLGDCHERSEGLSPEPHERSEGLSPEPSEGLSPEPHEQSEGLSPWRSPSLDAIAANLPYIPSADLPSLMPEVSRYEPRLALDGGPDGLALIRSLIASAPRYLLPDGVLALELGGSEQSDILSRELHDSGWRGIQSIPDYAGLQRHLFALRPFA